MVKPSRFSVVWIIIAATVLYFVTMVTVFMPKQGHAPFKMCVHDSIAHPDNIISGSIEADPSKDVVMDIGANIGLHALFFANAGYKVHAFEPMLANFNVLNCSASSDPVLRENLVLNNYGLGDIVTTSCVSASYGNLGSAKIVADTGSCQPENTIQVRRLDEYLNKHQIKPFLIKVDVEGYEFKALESAKEYLKRNPPAHIFSEFITTHLEAAGSDPKKYLDFFWDLGYKIEWKSERR
ncbi:methyltransferase FkbM [Rhizoclosmatium globosum]|uniref:Methyltransferase FkbM n=1 Tax=Rhizoclosmatium globosum TaxID=329046 RepID=A0A1Y2CV70_9FUNG|nr:methyltransferase FkbM [Rhizoclosmatium globosum]|eukprot:ORY50950.1 methyltransferase FkbM [Rhizoclosmatium globosum]